MPHLPSLSSREIINALSKLGYRKVRQRGSHIRLHCDGRKPITIPDHKVIGRGLLRKILRDAEVSPKKFIKLLK
jgi:predicted RNA binding protein YcfA (HicA-like mRNA interferase family)